MKSAEVDLNQVVTASSIGIKVARARLCELVTKGMVDDMPGSIKYLWRECRGIYTTDEPAK